jgi:hypothetical protein
MIDGFFHHDPDDQRITNGDLSDAPRAKGACSSDDKHSNNNVQQQTADASRKLKRQCRTYMCMCTLKYTSVYVCTQLYVH